MFAEGSLECQKSYARYFRQLSPRPIAALLLILNAPTLRVGVGETASWHRNDAKWGRNRYMTDSISKNCTSSSFLVRS